MAVMGRVWHEPPTDSVSCPQARWALRGLPPVRPIGKSGVVPNDAPPDFLTAHAAALLDKAAIIDPAGPTLTFGELEAAANRLANGLRGLGLRPRDRIVWCGPNSAEVL